MRICVTGGEVLMEKPGHASCPDGSEVGGALVGLVMGSLMVFFLAGWVGLIPLSSMAIKGEIPPFVPVLYGLGWLGSLGGMVSVRLLFGDGGVAVGEDTGLF